MSRRKAGVPADENESSPIILQSESPEIAPVKPGSGRTAASQSDRSHSRMARTGRDTDTPSKLTIATMQKDIKSHLRTNLVASNQPRNETDNGKKRRRGSESDSEHSHRVQKKSKSNGHRSPESTIAESSKNARPPIRLHGQRAPRPGFPYPTHNPDDDSWFR